MYRVIAIAMASAAGLLCQTAVASKDAGVQAQPAVRIADVAEFGPIGITTAMSGAMATLAGAPYSAQAVTERIQTLVDGNRIVQTTSGSVARDSQGRVRREESLPGLNSASGDAPHLVVIADPVAKLHWTLDPQTKTAIKMPFVQLPDLGPFMPPPGAEKTWFVAAGGGASEGHVQVIAKGEPSPDSNVSKVDLGTETMEGVPARGTRTTRIIPAGAMGNEQQIVITTETWYSPDLKVLILSKTSDPRMGETTYKLTNVQRSEPAPNWFQIPDDYTVKEQPADAFFHREVKKNP